MQICWRWPAIRSSKHVATKSSCAKATKDGGAEGIRTPDPHNAIVVLYQLSYDPIQCEKSNVPAPFVKTFALLFCLAAEKMRTSRGFAK